MLDIKQNLEVIYMLFLTGVVHHLFIKIKFGMLKKFRFKNNEKRCKKAFRKS